MFQILIYFKLHLFVLIHHLYSVRPFFLDTFESICSLDCLLDNFESSISLLVQSFYSILNYHFLLVHLPSDVLFVIGTRLCILLRFIHSSFHRIVAKVFSGTAQTHAHNRGVAGLICSSDDMLRGHLLLNEVSSVCIFGCFNSFVHPEVFRIWLWMKQRHINIITHWHSCNFTLSVTGCLSFLILFVIWFRNPYANLREFDSIVPFRDEFRRIFDLIGCQWCFHRIYSLHSYFIDVLGEEGSLRLNSLVHVRV